MKYRCLPADPGVIYRCTGIYVCSTIQKQVCGFHIAVLRCHMQKCCSSQGQTTFGGASESEFGKPPMHQHRIGIQVSDEKVEPVAQQIKDGRNLVFRGTASFNQDLHARAEFG